MPIPRDQLIHITQEDNGSLGYSYLVDQAPDNTLSSHMVTTIMIENLQYMVRDGVQIILRHIHENDHQYRVK